MEDNLKLPSFFLTSKAASGSAVKSALAKFARPLRPEAPIIPQSAGEYQADLMFMPESYGKFNSGKKVILNLIHVPSRFLYSFLLKNKSEAAQTLIDIIPQLNPPMTALLCDQGTEFVNNKLSSFLEKEDITTSIINKSDTGKPNIISSHATAIVERVNKTVRDLIERYLSYAEQSGTNKFRFEPAFDELINGPNGYNNSIHSSLAGHTPKEALAATINPEASEATKKTALDLLGADAKKTIKQSEELARIAEKFPIGSYVHVINPPKNVSAYVKSSVAKFSDNVYKVVGHTGVRVIVSDPETDERESYLYHELVPAPAPHSTEKKEETHRILKKEAKAVNVARSEKREGIDRQNILPETEKRHRAPPAKYKG